MVRRKASIGRLWILFGINFLAVLFLLAPISELKKGPLSTAILPERLVSIEPLPEIGGEMCQFVQISMSMTGAPSLQEQTTATHHTPPPHPAKELHLQVAKRSPVYRVEDPHYAFAGIAVDPIRNEVVLADENVSSLVVYDRMTNTPPAAAMSEPKRVLGGTNTDLEYACSVYIDPETGDIYGVNNDTMNWMPVFGRDQEGNVKPKRRLQTPHTTFGVAADEEAKELFLTIQDDHAVIVFRKDAKNEDKALRVLQGRRTLMADPHGIALDPKRGEIIVSNWGTNNDRPPLSGGGGGDGRYERSDFPVGRTVAFLGSGKINAPSITVYSKNAHGDTAPLRVIQGARTQMDWPTAVAVHPEKGEIFVANDTADSITVYPAQAEGDIAPIRTIKGPRTMVKNPTGITIDLVNKELWVANFGSHAATVFELDANGNVAPKRVIRSGPASAPSPKLSNAHTAAFDSKRNEVLVAN
jgi:DNA-binding beta-propeller fold protein YncE